MKRFWYRIKKKENILWIFYKLMDEQGGLYFFQTQTVKAGNKKIKLVRALMRNNCPVVTKRLTLLNQIDLEDKEFWKEVDQEEMLGYLRRSNPDDNARFYLFQFFGYNIFRLTNFEREYFLSSFHTLLRLTKFYHAIKKECKERGTGYTFRSYRGKSVLITPNKIKKAMMELFDVDPQVILFKNEKS